MLSAYRSSRAPHLKFINTEKKSVEMNVLRRIEQTWKGTGKLSVYF